MVIARIVPMTMGKMLGGLYAILGLIGGVFLAIAVEGLRSLLMFFPADSAFGMDENSPISLILVLVLPLVYGVIGFISGVAIAWVYNWIARLFGGIELEYADPEGEVEHEEQGVFQ
ncbi:MAG: hypothetical protein ACI906_003284 [Candidatus Latescibacterota bacterium]|jgi:hypothetical protein